MSSAEAPVDRYQQPASHLLSRAIALLVPDRLLWLVVFAGGLLRLYRYDALSLWVDEGLTVGYARLPWDSVLGLHGAYETHPPLYFVSVKVAELFAPELNAGRLVSVLAGTLTLPLVFAFAWRLIGRWGALLAAGLLAISPLHIWYSQEARPYALCFLIVTVSYLSLAGFHQSLDRRWAILYGLSVALALYTEYSSIYALAPQALLLIYLLFVHSRRALYMWIAGVIGVVSFLPWLPQLLSTVHGMGTRTESYLGVSLPKVGTSILSILGIDGQGSYFWGSVPTAWDRWPALQAAMAVVAIMVCLLGLLALWGRGPFSLLTAISLFAGTIIVGALISLVSAGYAERTVIYVLLGWVLVAGAAPFVGRSRLLKQLGTASMLAVLFLSFVSLWAIYRGGDKQHWRELAQDSLAVEKSGQLLLMYPGVAGTIFDAYHPGQFDKAITIPDFSGLPDIAQPQRGTQSLWLAYIEASGIDHLRDQLAARGYHLVEHLYYWNPMYLDLYEANGTKQDK